MRTDPKISVVIACVDYADFLAITLENNRRSFRSITLVTAEGDSDTIELARMFDTRLVVTDAFYRNGEHFNKGAALNEGLQMASTGNNWLAVMDADILLPHDFGGFSWVDFQPGMLYVPHRRMLENPNDWTPELDWSTLPLRNEEPGGWLQIFHASDPVLQDGNLYPTMWKHAGGCDSAQWLRWGRRRIKRITEFEVLHLGRDGENWCGRVTPHVDGTEHPKAAERLAAMRALRENRKTKRGNDRFADERIDGKGGLR